MADFEHESGLPRAYDRHAEKPDFSEVVFQESDDANGGYLQGADLNELQSILRNKVRRVAGMTARDGNRIRGADINVNVDLERVRLTAGQVFLNGDVRDVPAAVLNDVPMTGETVIGVRLISETVTYDDDADLLGLHAGSDAQGEPTAARVRETVSWGWRGDSQQGQLYSVYRLLNGVPLDQDLPAELSGVNNAIAIYDRGAHGHYVVKGCKVTALGRRAGKQAFTIGRGEANIMGFKRTRKEELRLEVLEAPDTALIEAELKFFDDAGSGTAVIKVNHFPISSVTTVVVERERTDTVTRGGTTNGKDTLTRTSVLSLIEVKQGGTTYTTTTDYVLDADKVSWAPGGIEPAGGSTYTVKYRYLDAVSPGTGYTFNDKTITILTGVTGGQVILTYAWKLPRVDLVCLNRFGAPVYITGDSDDDNPLPPIYPASLLVLAEVTNKWIGRASVKPSGIRSVPYAELIRYIGILFDQQYLIAQERLARELDARDPAAKRGTFVDPFTDDLYRDAGVAQTAAINGGRLTLAIDPTFFRQEMPGPVMLEYEDENIINQPLYSECQLINPFLVFDPEPIEIALDPPTDFWTEFDTIWLSKQTDTFGFGNQVATQTEEEQVDQRVELLEFLREIDVDFTVRGMIENETLDELTFDGIDVLPAGPPLTAGPLGTVSGTFTIPEKVKAGKKTVRAVTGAMRKARSFFVGQGRVEIEVMREVTTVTRTQDFVDDEIGGNDGNRDPLAQTFMLTESRFITAVDLRFCARGSNVNGVTVNLVTVENGIPTRTVWGQSNIDMADVVLNTFHRCRLVRPVWVPADVEVAWVIKTDDALHSVSIARLGSIDLATGDRIAAQPYTVGVFLVSSNARTWTPVQDADLCFRVVAAKFLPVEKVYNFGPINVTDMSDVVIRAAVDLPDEDARFYFELVRASGQVIRLKPFQAKQFKSYITETVNLRAVLKGTSKVSPILYPGVTLVTGEIRTSGTYVTVSFPSNAAVTIANYLKALIPSGASVNVQVDTDLSGTWQSMPLITTTVLNDGWVETFRERTTGIAGASLVRMRVILNGTPAARPQVSDFMALAK